MTEIYEQASSLLPYTQSIRRDLHKHPELGFEENRTAQVIIRELNALGLEVHTGIAQTGVVALLSGAKPGPVVLVRADMDALPIQEQTNTEYTSQEPGKMHACGHDGHVAIGLTVARMLHSRKAELVGTVKFIFQPAEEGVIGPQGMGGAEWMVAQGILENPRPDIAFSLHLWNERPLGWVNIAAGPVMAGAELFKIKVIGRGGHGAMPHLAADPLLAGAQIVTALQSVIARNVSPLNAAVVTIGKFYGGTAFNIIPHEIEMEGTIRTFDPDVRATVLRRVEEIARQIAEGMGCRAEFTSQRVTPALINQPEAAAIVQQVAQRVLPQAKVDTSPYLTMGSEDMAFILEQVKGCYFFIGSANPEKGLDYGHHHPKFDFDETAMIHAATLMSGAVMEYLGATP